MSAIDFPLQAAYFALANEMQPLPRSEVGSTASPQRLQLGGKMKNVLPRGNHSHSAQPVPAWKCLGLEIRIQRKVFCVMSSAVTEQGA